MKIDAELESKIQAYLDRDLPDHEWQTFHELVKADETLQKMVKIIALERMAADMALKNKLRENLRAEELAQRRKRVWLILGLVVFASIVGTVTYYYKDPGKNAKHENQITETIHDSLTTDQPTQEKNSIVVDPPPRLASAARKNYTVIAFKVGPKSVDTDGPDSSKYDLAALAFDAKNYKRAYELLQTPDVDQRMISIYLRGHAAFNLGKYDEAARDFKLVAQSGSLNKESAEWYGLLAELCRVPLDTLAANQLFDTIKANRHHKYRKDAMALKKVYAAFLKGIN
ncbi:MAG: hypothetical protein JNJ57_16675 [Saprospiraceae bacterium]|nr:hypothetical protein [Saprospiraceae bacterium]